MESLKISEHIPVVWSMPSERIFRDRGEYDLNYYFCDACRYCFSAEKLPDRCPDCGAVAHDNKKAVRPASKTEIEELLKIQKEDTEDTQNEST